MIQENKVTRKLLLLLVGLIVVVLLQKNGNFFPIFFLGLSFFLILKNKSRFSKKDFFTGLALSILSLNPVYGICIVIGYMGASGGIKIVQSKDAM